MPLVYVFGEGNADGNAQMSDVLGGKGANLAEMTNLGIPVPPGFTTSAQLCTAYLAERRLPDELKREVQAAMGRLEQYTGRTFGGGERPLLVSVRSGAKFSMPGMMDTILNLGLNEATAEGLVRESGNRQFVFDSYRRFVQMYGNVVFGIKGATEEGDPFEEALEKVKRDRGYANEISTWPPTISRRLSPRSRRSSSGRPDTPSPTIRGSSCGEPLRLYTGAGTAVELSITVACTGSRAIWARRST
jgi:pyruvate,orthophosphate dikinase